MVFVETCQRSCFVDARGGKMGTSSSEPASGRSHSPSLTGRRGCGRNCGVRRHQQRRSRSLHRLYIDRRSHEERPRDGVCRSVASSRSRVVSRHFPAEREVSGGEDFVRDVAIATGAILDPTTASRSMVELCHSRQNPSVHLAVARRLRE